LFPDWELAVLSLPCRDEAAQKKTLVDACSMLQKSNMDQELTIEG